MRIQCKCGRAMSVDSVEHAGKKVACSQCGQRYRIPPRPDGGAPAAPDRPDAPALQPSQAGVVALGQKTSILWILISMIITLVITVGGGYGAKLGLKKLISMQDFQEYRQYVVFAVMWAPCLAFVIAGWITARFSPGKTITEPALGAILAILAVFLVLHFRPGPVRTYVSYDLAMGEATALKLNFLLLGMFVAAMLACAGAYFGEVSQSRAVILSEASKSKG